MVLDGKVAIVTGASQGIGEATARRFAEEGAHVVLSDMDESVHAAAQSILRDHPGSEAFGVVTDPTSPADCEALVAQARSRHGRVDILVIATAISHRRLPVTELDPADWDRVLAVNLKGPFLFCRAAIPAMSSPGGRIVFTASYTGQVGQRDFSAYCASKGGLRTLIHSLALELAELEITVNGVAPAMVESALERDGLAMMARESGISVDELKTKRYSAVPLKRPARAREVADAMLYLASPDASYVTGACLDVNGGVLLR